MQLGDLHGFRPRAVDSDTAVLIDRMARIGRAFAPSFSPDGRQVALISDLTGIPQVWIVPTAGGWPRLVTNGDDPVGRVRWSPTADWLAITVLPGGGLNSQIYVIRPDGTGMRRLTDGGKERNELGDWTDDGRFLTMSSNRARSRIDGRLSGRSVERHHAPGRRPERHRRDHQHQS